ncbi:sigma-70 family RNA polymerase sigma factor [bacterium]|nr:sigma-70 family RNA polymerase sigma factor [candidate division CSSED10-310 bacterium]
MAAGGEVRAACVAAVPGGSVVGSACAGPAPPWIESATSVVVLSAPVRLGKLGAALMRRFAGAIRASAGNGEVMARERRAQVTEILSRRDGDCHSEELFAILYDELRMLARRYIGRRTVTIQPTELVHETWLKLVDQSRVDWRGKTHFFAVSALVMKRVLIDAIRRRKSVKRGGACDPVTLDRVLNLAAGGRMDPELAVALYDALEKLAQVDEREARVVELRIFGGLTVEESARYLGVSTRTVNSDWLHARAWLRRELAGAAVR